MRAARFKVSGQLLREALHMPPDSRFVAAEVAANWTDDDWLEFVVVDDTLPQHSGAWEAEPRVIKHDDGNVARVEWDWGIKT